MTLDRDEDRTDRRAFLQAGALATAAAVGVDPIAVAQDPAVDKSPPTVPRRMLGKTGVEITMLDQGAIRGPSLDNVLRFSYSQGVRVFDTAKVYGSEPNFKKWFAQSPEVRKEIFLVTKDELRSASQMVASVDQRLVACGTDHIDLYFLHGLGDHHTVDEAANLLKSREFREAADAIRKSGKARFIGFSTHHKDRAAIIQAAAEAGVVDAIMLQYTPWLDKESPLNKALDAAHARGIGLISMKQIAGRNFGDAPKGNILEEVTRRAPMLAEKKLTPFQGLLHAIWSDERISSVCVSMRNTDQIRENVNAARRYEPLKAADIRALGDAVVEHRPTLCADCDGRCSAAGGTNTDQKSYLRSLRYGAAQIVRIFSGSRQTALQATTAASRRAS
jgi:uncharacterized protein